MVCFHGNTDQPGCAIALQVNNFNPTGSLQTVICDDCEMTQVRVTTYSLHSLNNTNYSFWMKIWFYQTGWWRSIYHRERLGKLEFQVLALHKSETSAFHIFHGGNSTFKNLINLHVSLSHQRSTKVFLETIVFGTVSAAWHSAKKRSLYDLCKQTALYINSFRSYLNLRWFSSLHGWPG